MAGPAHDTLPPPVLDTPAKVLIVVAPYYRAVAEALLKGARAALEKAGVAHETVEVPGALEIATAVRIAYRQAGYDGFVALGCVARGKTSHYEVVASESARALTLLGLDGACIGNGILTVETLEQAEMRADPQGHNKGGGAAEAALHLIALTRRWKRPAGGVGFAPGSAGPRADSGTPVA